MLIYILYAILIVVALFFATLSLFAIRAKNNVPTTQKLDNLPKFEENGVKRDYVKNFCELIRIKTISHTDAKLDDENEFELFLKKLQELYPTLFEKCEPVFFGTKGVLLRIKGDSDKQPSVLMAHYDVVTVDEAKWTHPPFCGDVINGEVWGRGTIDTKITVFGIAEACENLVLNNFKPKNDIYIAFGGDEEVNGSGARDIIAHLKSKNVKPALVVDEGGAVVDKIMPGMAKPVAVIGIGEKGQMNATLKLTGEGGHASRPSTPSLLGKMCKAVQRCEKSRFPGHVTAPVKGMFASIAPHVGFGMRLIYANMWFFGNIFCALGEVMGSEFNAMFRTTLAFTTAKASDQYNVMPTEVSVGVNIRSLNTDTAQSIKERIQRIIKDKDIDVTFDMAYEASPYAPCEGENWQCLVNAVGEVFPNAVAAPYLMMAATDSRFYNGFCDNIYKFSPVCLSKEQRMLIHSNDERLPVKDIEKAVEFFTALAVQL